uniref:Uncharacterized protein n=1 Tax=Chelydra serpentina TaxID=8475 RepID=A0A8C3XN90_CHESE
MAAISYKLLCLLFTIHVESGMFYYPWVSKKVPCEVHVENSSSSIIFDCRHQNLEAVPLEINDNATCLILSYYHINKISNVTFQKFRNLTQLYLKYNAINQAMAQPLGFFRNLTKLEKLDLSHNHLQEVPKGLSPSITSLELNANQIVSIKNNTFSELKNLKELYMDWNYLSHNKHYFRLAGVTVRLAFIEKLPQLKVLNLSWNSISTLTDRQLSSNSLQELVFKGNCLGILWGDKDEKYIHFFTNLSSLTYLDISHNRLLKIPSEAFLSLPPNLTQLFLNNNRLQVFIFANFTRLKYLKLLDLSQNKFRTIHISFKVPAVSAVKG